VAVPFAVAKSTLTVCEAGIDKETVNVAGVVPELPSVTVTSLTDNVGCFGVGAAIATAAPTSEATTQHAQTPRVTRPINLCLMIVRLAPPV
jgi:hypothetical protein